MGNGLSLLAAIVAKYGFELGSSAQDRDDFFLAVGYKILDLEDEISALEEKRDFDSPLD